MEHLGQFSISTSSLSGSVFGQRLQVVDNLMFQWATDPLIDLPNRFGLRLFSRRNWSEFLTYLDELEADRGPEVEEALKMIRPVGARTPEWIRRGSAIRKDLL